MIAVIFEVEPHAAGRDQYFELAKTLAPVLEKNAGCISVERFQSLSHPEKFLSLSFWRDEQSLRAWREHAEHRFAQQAGRETLFSDYRLRVATVVRDYGLSAREQVPS
jgi:heme-degrading monooxygenase HmoA